jgi:uncharacterized protein YuzE
MVVKGKQKLNVDYDKEGDVLYVTVGDPRNGYYEEDPSGVLLRLDIDTDEVIGFMIYNYSRKKSRKQISNIPFFPDFVLPDTF